MKSSERNYMEDLEFEMEKIRLEELRKRSKKNNNVSAKVKIKKNGK